MLTGQGNPEGALPVEMKFVVAATAILSVPFFAIPAAMLTSRGAMTGRDNHCSNSVNWCLLCL